MSVESGKRALAGAASDREGVDARAIDFYNSDLSLKALLAHYLADEERRHLEPHLTRLGRLVGGRLDDLAREADLTPPRLEVRNRLGEDRQRVLKAPAYRALEELAFGTFALACLSHRPALGADRPLAAVGKYALTYLFAQSEFGVLCPVNMTDSLTRTLRRFADTELLARYLPGLLGKTFEGMLQGAMFMTERHAGSDVGATATRAVRATGEFGDHWLLTGEKWFCSNADADLALVMARPEGAPDGTAGLGLFLMPKVLPCGAPNRYRIVRLKDKLGTRAMPTGEIVLEGATAWLVGDPGQGFKQMTEMVNQSRLSNGVRSTGIMRRAVHEALGVALSRRAFGKPLIALPLMRRQLIKMVVPAEAALCVALFAANCLERADAGDAAAQAMRRILTPLLKLRACRDARKVAGDAMEVRGGNGYIEEWIEPRLLREAHLGSIWEGASNVIALDVVRAAAKGGAHRVLAEPLAAIAGDGELAGRLRERLHAALALTDGAGRQDGDVRAARQAAGGLYYATAACLLLGQGRGVDPRAGGRQDDGFGADLARLLLAHKLCARDPLRASAREDEAAADRVLDALVAARVAA
jgi:alkylation response protein AidB-like acyl-CoA dehydrogenase